MPAYKGHVCLFRVLYCTVDKYCVENLLLMRILVYLFFFNFAISRILVLSFPMKFCFTTELSLHLGYVFWHKWRKIGDL